MKFSSPREAAGADATVVLGVAASDAHVVANHLIAHRLRQLGYRVVNLGACTPVADFVAAMAVHPAALAVVIGSLNGHALEDLAPLRGAKDRGQLPCPVIVGGNLSVGSAKTGREPDALRAIGADYVLADIDELVETLHRLRARRSVPDGVAVLSTDSATGAQLDLIA